MSPASGADGRLEGGMSADELDVVEGMLRRQEQVSQAVVGQLVGEVRRLEEKAERLREALAQAGGGMVPA